MASKAFKSLVDGFNAQIKTMRDNNLLIYDEENPEFFITGVDYRQEDDKLVFKTEEDHEEFKRITEDK